MKLSKEFKGVLLAALFVTTMQVEWFGGTIRSAIIVFIVSVCIITIVTIKVIDYINKI